MATYNGQNFTGLTGLYTKGTIALRFAADVSGNESTLSVRPSQDTARAYFFPDKSGTFPITGTFAVQLPAVAATTFAFSTIATVTGIRAEDALTVSLQGGTSATYGTETTAKILWSSTPGNGNITMRFINLGAATGYTEHVFAYTAAR